MPSLKDVVEKMSEEQSNSTLGWDVVVNYSDAELNALLKDSYHNDPKNHVTTLSLPVTGYDEDLNPYVINFQFELGPPLITFVGTGVKPACTLTLPINGGSSATSKSSQPIPSGSYEIKLMNLELATMSGNASGKIPSDKPFVFPPEGSKPAAVTIDFHTSQSLVAKLILRDQAPVNKHVEAHRGNLEGQVFSYFTDPEKVSSVQYQLATVGGAPSPGGSLVLHPMSFRFAVYHSEQYPRTILSLFIETAEGLGGKTELDLQQSWQAKWIGDASYKLPPIPDSHTASIIINNALMINKVIAPALKKAGVDVAANYPQWVKNVGYKYKLKTHRKVHRDAWQEGPPTLHYERVTAVDVNLDDDDKLLDLTLGQNGNPGQLAVGALTWGFGYEVQYGRSHCVQLKDGPHWTHQYAKANINHNLNKSTNNILTDSALRLDISISKGNWSKEIKKENPSIWSSMFGGQTSIPGWVTDMLPEMPGFEITLGDIYFFLTTNLLLPGQKVIAVDASANGGLRIPRDFYIVGKIVQK